jgi:hypothetical protein
VTGALEPPQEGRAGLRGLLRDLVSFDRRAAVILVYVPVALTLMEYVFLPESRWRRPIPEWTRNLIRDLRARFPDVPADLMPWLWWGAGCLTVLVVVPMILLRLLAKTGPRETGLRVRGTGRDALVYLLLYVVFVPVVWLVSMRPDFRATYPFYPRAPRAIGWDFVAFEAVYFLQFLSVEYFFRGFMTLGLKPALGRASVLVMLAPYCMIHFHKPMLEALGAIGAGLVLGALAWRTRTVVYGWFLHYAVALTMDLLSLSQSGRL